MNWLQKYAVDRAIHVARAQRYSEGSGSRTRNRRVPAGSSVQRTTEAPGLLVGKSNVVVVADVAAALNNSPREAASLDNLNRTVHSLHGDKLMPSTTTLRVLGSATPFTVLVGSSAMV